MRNLIPRNQLTKQNPSLPMKLRSVDEEAKKLVLTTAQVCGSELVEMVKITAGGNESRGRL